MIMAHKGERGTVGPPLGGKWMVPPHLETTYRLMRAEGQEVRRIARVLRLTPKRRNSSSERTGK
jgi:hypothetical protein